MLPFKSCRKKEPSHWFRKYPYSQAIKRRPSYVEGRWRWQGRRLRRERKAPATYQCWLCKQEMCVLHEMYVICHWVGSDSWWLYEWGMSTVSCSRQPFSSFRLMPVASFMKSINLYLVFFFSCYFLFFPALLSFPKNPPLPWRADSRRASVLPFLPPVMFQA